MDIQGHKAEESSNSSSMPDISVLEKYVKQLYEYRDHYFDHHSIEEAFLKDERVNEKMQETLKLLKDFDCATLKVEGRARYYYLLGRTYDVGTLHSPEGEAALAKAVKLDPQLVEAWNQLGECYWKRGNIKEAKNCFQGALNKRKNIVSLRNLSILVRQEETSTREERIKNVELGLDLAKQAVEMEPGDPESWMVLGNAFLAMFFNVQQNPRTLKQAMTAYSQAEADPMGKNNHDLHYNKAVALKYEEEYPKALMEFARTCELNPSWETPRRQQQQLLQYLDATADLLRAHGRLKAKKLQALLQSIDEKQLGPYEGGQYGSGGQTVKLVLQPLSGLKPGVNSEVVVLGKVICSVRNEDSVPFTFCLMDKQKSLCAVTVYNMAEGQGVIIGDSVAIPKPYVTTFTFCLIDKQKSVCAVTVYNMAEGQGVIIGDSVAIPEPYVTNVAFSYGSRKYSFLSIRVDNPLVMVVNGKKVGRDKLAGTKLSTLPLTH